MGSKTPQRDRNGDEDAAALLSDLSTLINDDRDTHGDAVQQQERAAEAWTWYLQIHGKLKEGTKVSGADVARLMALLKLSRGGVGEYDLDHDRDLAGYGAIAAACEVSLGTEPPESLTRGDE